MLSELALIGDADQKISLRGTRQGAALVAPASPAYYQAVDRGNVYSCAMQSGVASQAGLSGTTPILTLYNPANSPVDLVVHYAAVTASVAVAAAAVVWIGLHETSPAAKAVSALGTLSTAIRNRKVGFGDRGRGQALLACTAATPIAYQTLGVLFAAALTVNNQQAPVGGWLDGSLILQPDTAISFQTSTASGAAGLFGDYIWEERTR